MEITWLFLEFIIQMLYLQSIPSRSHKGAQTHAVGPNNNLIIYPYMNFPHPQMSPFPPNGKITVESQECCFVWPLFTSPALLQGFPSLPLSPPAASASRTPTRL